MFPERLKELRLQRKITQKELASLLSVQNTAISKYELGEREPDFDTLEKIADYFEVSIDYLLGRTKIRNGTTSYLDQPESISIIRENIADYSSLTKDINALSQESQEEIKKLIELYKIKEIQDRNKKNKNEINGIG